jgi:hypothetical protein
MKEDIDYIINRAIKGDDKAFEQLININKEKLYKIAYISEMKNWRWILLVRLFIRLTLV